MIASRGRNAAVFSLGFSACSSAAAIKSFPRCGNLRCWPAVKLFALEFSTAAASLALLEDGALVASAPVDASQRRSQGLFAAAEHVLQCAGWGFADVGAFAVGRGPGSYTGLRVSMTAARGWALPENKPVWTISSAAALAAEIFAEQPAIAQAVVSGDARRGTIWAGLFERAVGVGVQQISAWQLLPADVRGNEWPGAHWAEVGRAPRAEWVGQLFFAGGASEELQPIYLHPAVAVAPNF